MDKPLTIGGLARASGVTPDTIRYYERLGLLPRPHRTAAGYRTYGPAIARRMVLIRNAKAFGFTLAEVAGFLRDRDAGRVPCAEVRRAAQRRLEAVDRQMADLAAERARMVETLEVWDDALARTPPGRPAQLLERVVSR